MFFFIRFSVSMSLFLLLLLSLSLFRSLCLSLSNSYLLWQLSSSAVNMILHSYADTTQHVCTSIVARVHWNRRFLSSFYSFLFLMYRLLKVAHALCSLWSSYTSCLLSSRCRCQIGESFDETGKGSIICWSEAFLHVCLSQINKKISLSNDLVKDIFKREPFALKWTIQFRDGFELEFLE